ncbi:BCS1 protein precursor [Purpureocillium lilacinum]|uniref:BCS1 protein n=1 Tax=Purpureocillium lilacinum TaxID=33203 RepID=A0A179FAS8_PURLI|nr:BCS1 protein precursor [Purpureocillium lilacinum]OAQ62556.1 BCS1 protein precursor [Purpureocillium lilacinum]
MSDGLPSSCATTPVVSRPSQFPTVLVDSFVPGFSVLTSAAKAYLNIDINAYIPMVLMVVAMTVAWSFGSDPLWNFVHSYLLSSVTIRADDEAYNVFILWLSQQRFARSSRHSFANTDISSRHWYTYMHGDSGDEEEEEYTAALPEHAKLKTGSRKGGIHYTPAFGSHYFWYRGHLLVFERRLNNQESNFQSMSEREELVLLCFGRNPGIIKDLLSEARQAYMKRDEQKTLIYRGNFQDTSWKRCMSRLNRALSTVFLDGKSRQDLLNDARDYLDPETQRWYANRGIPYRRGYLFHGPPGTGKSSLSLALAALFRLKIYIVSLSSALASEEKIMTLFNELPVRCIVLLEDIDTAGLAHTREESSAQKSHVTNGRPDSHDGQQQADAGSIPTANKTLSLSGLLNILDGVAAQEGRILIMTTNYIDKLDKALIRPGRVDKIIPFGLADRDIASSIFRAIYAPFENELTDISKGTRGDTADDEDKGGSMPEDATAAKRQLQSRERIDDFALCFASKLPEREFSPAEIQGLLLQHKHQPEKVIETVDQWVATMRRQKSEEEQARRYTE